MAKRRRRTQGTPEVHPLDVDGVRTVAIGTVLWAAAFVVLALRKDSLDEQGHGWWLWTCLAGVGLGLLGLEYTRKRRDAIARALLDEEADLPDGAEPIDGAEEFDDVQTDHVEPATGRRARRAARNVDRSEPVEPDRTAAFPPLDLDQTDESSGAETGEPEDTGDDLGKAGDRPSGGRRARRNTGRGGKQSTDGGASYRGRRTRRG